MLKIFCCLLALVILLLVAKDLYRRYYQKDLETENLVINKSSMAKPSIRQTAVAGNFYPADPAELKKLLTGYLGNTRSNKPSGELKAIVVPHAGYEYSASVAAYAYSAIESQFSRVVLIGPSHHYAIRGLVLADYTLWQTPLGEVKVSPVNKELAASDFYTVNNKAHDPEHALELQLPFLQLKNPEAEILPILVGALDIKQQQQFAAELLDLSNKKTLIIASADLSHYHPFAEGKALDDRSIKDILDLDSEEIINDEIDATWALASLLKVASSEHWQPVLLKQSDSSAVSGDKSSVVGYAALAFYGQEKESADFYSETEKEELLQLARQTLTASFSKEKLNFETTNLKLSRRRGVFVTLMKEGQLRGCIGYLNPEISIWQAVQDNAMAAAFSDKRFSPVTEAELADLEIEISILTNPVLDSREAIIKNHYGVVLEQGGRRATYLPQVWDDLSDPEEFFGSLCQKAGLKSDCYLDEQTKYYSYQAIVFGEK